MITGLLAETGRALYGERWQSEVARALNVSDRTMRRWVAGQDAPRPGVYLDLLRLVMERAVELDELADKLRQVG